MIKSISASNFQSHRESKLKLHPNVNVIVGASDSGKTAIIRALRWLVWNRPSGEAFRSTWGGDIKVEVELDTQTIERFRGSKNEYRIGKTVFSAMRTDVPIEVASLLNMSEINLQQQFARPWLLDNSPGEVAQFFNAIAKLDAIDRSLRNIQSWARNISQGIEHDQNNLDNLKLELVEQYSDVEKLDVEVGRLEKLEARQREIGRAHDLIDELVRKSIRVDSDIILLSPWLDLEPEVNIIVQLHGRIQSLQDRHSKLEALLLTAANLAGDVTDLTRLVELKDLLQNPLDLIVKRDGVISREAFLKRSVDHVKETSEDLSEAETNLSGLQEQFEDNFPQICPLCGKER